MAISTIEMMDRERKNKSFRIDETILDALSGAARKQNTSLSRYVESVLMNHCIDKGLIPQDTEPLGETRGVGNKKVDHDE